MARITCGHRRVGLPESARTKETPCSKWPLIGMLTASCRCWPWSRPADEVLVANREGSRMLTRRAKKR